MSADRSLDWIMNDDYAACILAMGGTDIEAYDAVERLAIADDQLDTLNHGQRNDAVSGKYSD